MEELQEGLQEGLKLATEAIDKHNEIFEKMTNIIGSLHKQIEQQQLRLDLIEEKIKYLMENVIFQHTEQ